jgi:hypothetical protein
MMATLGNGVPSSETGQVSAFCRLRSLPPLFDLDELERTLGMTRKSAAYYAYRWKTAGLVSPLGPSASLWFNLVVDPNGPQARRGEAVVRLLGRPAVVVGGAALHQGGWTTQRHHMLPLAVPIARTQRTLPHLGHNIELLPRSLKWFRSLQMASLPGPDKGVRIALPEMALADALFAQARGTGRSSGHVMSWQVACDEVDLDDEDEDAPKVVAALSKLGASGEEAEELLERFDWDVAPASSPGHRHS